ncbi:MAG: hypothetical protein JSS36_00160 [Proteobacteria bacterium]|nr:hypothetical protein [Pseudomonadota bacterium]
MAKIFIVQHENPETADVKLIGVYSSHDAANSAVARLTVQPGFRGHPNGFSIDCYTIDKDHWVEGYGPA